MIVHKPTRYMAPENRSINENPKCNAMIIGSIDPITEAHPFAAQAQGISSFSKFESILTPRGKGIPKRSPNGNMISGVTRNLVAMDKPRRARRNGDINPYKGAITTIVNNKNL